MTSNAIGVDIPLATDPFDPQGDMVKLANSLRSQIIVPVANVTERNALVSAIDWTPSASAPLRVTRADASPGSRDEVTYNGATWSVTPSYPAAANRRVASRLNSNQPFTSGSFVGIVSAALPASAPAGVYLVSFTLIVSSTTDAIAYLQGTFGGVNVTGDDAMSLDVGDITVLAATVPVDHTGGTANVVLNAQVSAGTPTARAGCRVSAVWTGPL